MTPDEYQQSVQAMLQALQSGQTAVAREKAETLLRMMPAEPNACQVLAMLHLQKGEADKALAHLRAADRAAPGHPPVLNMLGVAYKQLDRRDEARAIFEQACAKDPAFLDARLNLAQLDLDDVHLDEARASFDLALALDNSNATALAGRARVALFQYNNDEAAAFAEQALAAQPHHTLAALTLAVARLRKKEFTGARDIALTTARREGTSAINKAYGLGFAADAEDRLEHFDQAFDLYTEANDIQVDLFRYLEEGSPSPFSPQHVRRIREFLETNDTLPLPCPDTEPMPIFLVGFPRSGTTLLEQVLMAHPRIESFGEHAALLEACGAFFISEEGFQSFDTLDADAAAACRVRYWREVEKLGQIGKGNLLLDKMPLNTVLLPAVAKIFPRAKILFALRDPRDVVLSCFQQRFGMNQAMYQFLTLEGAAAYYDLVMDLGMKVRDRCEFALRDVRYGDVVTDLEQEARSVISFLGLEWDAQVLAYREGVKTRAINTPSVNQVIEPIYTRSQGKWRNYETHIQPVRALLDPWAKRFGFA